MATAVNSRIWGTILLTITIFSLSLPAYAQYSGGTGDPNDPYQIATAEDLMLLGETPEDYDKHFILIADIDMDPNLPGRRVFHSSVIGRFTSVFDGNGHAISHLTIVGGSFLGLFRHLACGAKITNLGLEDVKVSGTGDVVGGLVGINDGSITRSYSTGMVTGNEYVGGLVGTIQWEGGITMIYSTCTVTGDEYVGGLVGNNDGSITISYSTGTVKGDEYAGGLVGLNGGNITTSYSTGMVTGNMRVGGLVGFNGGGDLNGSITSSYSIGVVGGTSDVGGLVGDGSPISVTACFWDIDTSGQTTSVGGVGLTTAEMQDIEMFLGKGWDFVDEILNGTCDYWQISPGDYPLLRYQAAESPVMSEGLGTTEQPYLIRDIRDLGTMCLEPTAHYRLGAPVDLSGITWSMAVIPWFGGTFDGNGHTISHLTIKGGSYLGLFGHLGYGAKVSNLGLEAVDVNGTGNTIGGLAGENGSQSSITKSYSKGTVSGVSYAIGGLVGSNLPLGSITDAYSNAMVIGDRSVGGLVGWNWMDSNITNSYCTGMVSGTSYNVGGFLGRNGGSAVDKCFWDIETSGQITSSGGTGKTTAQMQTAETFYGWIRCGEEPIWTIDEGSDYPRLYWENKPGEKLEQLPLSGLLTGTGTKDDPYLIHTPEELNLISLALCDLDKHFKLMADIDLSDFSYDTALIAWDTDDAEGGFQGIPFTGVFDGNGHIISYLTIMNADYLGLFGRLESGAKILDLGLKSVDIKGTGSYVGGLVGSSGGSITTSFCTGNITGENSVGGLVGSNEGSISSCYSISQVAGASSIGGLVGSNISSASNITSSYSTGIIAGNEDIGGLVGRNDGDRRIRGSTTMSFWDMETSGQVTSAGGSGKTTAEMQTTGTFYGWIKCGQEPIWTIDEGNDYPRLYWENKPGEILKALSLSDLLSGTGIEDDPYLIHTPEELNLVGLGLCDWDRHFRLMADIDLSGYSYNKAVIAKDTDDVESGFQGIPFTGNFDGNGHTISNLTIDGKSYLGLFGQLESGGKIFNLGLDAVDVNATGNSVGGLAGLNLDGKITTTYSTGRIEGKRSVGSLVGSNWKGSITTSYSSGSVSGTNWVGGLVGRNGGDIRHCYSVGAISGKEAVGGLVGSNIGPQGTVTDCYSTGAVDGTEDVGGLVGKNGAYVIHCYSTGDVRATGNTVGGLLGGEHPSIVIACFWDTETSGLLNMCGIQVYGATGCDDSYGKTTAEMRTASTFLDAGWDFMDEVENGTEDIWWILEGQNYPRLWWEEIER